jgi:hypothetical protein
VVAKDQQRWFSYSAAGFSISKMDSFASWAVVPPFFEPKEEDIPYVHTSSPTQDI